jgi:hypothetical protein
LGRAAKSHGEGDTAHADGRAACVCVNQRRVGSTGRARRAASEARCAGFGSEETHPSLHPACRCRWRGSGRAICSRADPATPPAGHQGLGTGRRLPPSATVNPTRRQPEGPWHSLVEGVLRRFDRITPRAPSTLVKATAARVKRSVCTRLNQFGSITGKGHENGVRSQANVRVKAHAAEMRSKGNVLPSRMTARHLRPAGTDCGWMRGMQMADQLFGAEGGFSRSGNPAGSGCEFSTIRRCLACRFCENATIGDRRHNRLLQLAVVGAPFLRIDRAGPAVAEGRGHLLSHGFVSGINQSTERGKRPHRHGTCRFSAPAGSRVLRLSLSSIDLSTSNRQRFRPRSAKFILVNVLRPIGEPIKLDLNAVRSATAASSPSRSRPEPHSVPRPLYKTSAEPPTTSA